MTTTARLLLLAIITPLILNTWLALAHACEIEPGDWESIEEEINKQ